MSDTTASATRIDADPSGMSALSAATIPHAAPLEGFTPTVVMTWYLKRNDADSARPTTKLIFKAHFRPSTKTHFRIPLDQVNRAAEQSFSRSLNSHKNTTGFQYLLQQEFSPATASAVTSHDFSRPLEADVEKTLNRLIRSFGALLKSHVEQDLAHELNHLAPESLGQRRTILSGHVGIAPLEVALDEC